mmetsp:Transcript_74881/g.146510  ORF Transcript_74881/g.146510 Transcript_74881/m.146510 type:complete len:148 (+) Transcript_74881:76-519(+)
MGNASLTSMFDRSKFPSLLNVDVYSFKASDNGEKAQTIATSIAKKLGLLQTRAVAGFAPVQAYQTKKKKKEDQEGKAPATRSSVESVANSRRFSVSSPSSFSSSSSFFPLFRLSAGILLDVPNADKEGNDDGDEDVPAGQTQLYSCD